MVLFYDCVYIFYNTLPTTLTKIKFDKNNLAELREYRINRKNTQVVPLGFKLGTLGGSGGIRKEQSDGLVSRRRALLFQCPDAATTKRSRKKAE